MPLCTKLAKKKASIAAWWLLCLCIPRPQCLMGGLTIHRQHRRQIRIRLRKRRGQALLRKRSHKWYAGTDIRNTLMRLLCTFPWFNSIAHIQCMHMRKVLRLYSSCVRRSCARTKACMHVVCTCICTTCIICTHLPLRVWKLLCLWQLVLLHIGLMHIHVFICTHAHTHKHMHTHIWTCMHIYLVCMRFQCILLLLLDIALVFTSLSYYMHVNDCSTSYTYAERLTIIFTRTLFSRPPYLVVARLQ
jgi:hypothetical protein